MKFCKELVKKGVVLGITAFLLSFTLASAQEVVTGTITDTNGYPLPGASILEKGTSNGAQTDFDGNYSLELQSENAILVVSYIGYVTKELSVDGKSVINIVLTEDVSQLDEVVLIGYGSVKKRDVTGAVIAIGAKDLNQGAALSPQQLLQGKASGVNVSQGSGRPGSKVSVQIRGANSVNFGGQPLYVIDGVPVNFSEGSFAGNNTISDRSNREATNPLNMINASDIERIDILKDASATAIYGSRASNGVIIITTKKAKEGLGKISYNTYVGISSISRKLPVLDANQVRAFNAANPDADFVDGGANTDWQDEIYRDAITQSHSLAFSGGANGTNYLASLSYQDNEGIIISSALENVNARMNINSKFLEGKLGINANMIYADERSDNVPSVSGIGGDGGGDVIRDALRANPTLPVRDPNSPYTGGYSYIAIFAQNPVEQAELVRDFGISKRFLANVTANLELSKDLNFITNIGVTQENRTKQSYTPLSTRIGFETNAFANYQTVDASSKLIETTLDYHKNFSEDHDLKVLLGYSWQEFASSGTFIRRSNFLEDIVGFNSIQAGGNIGAADSFAADNRIVSFFGRVTYSLFDKYLFTGTLRRDGSSKFGANNKWGLFPSASIAWKVSDEPFLKDNETVSSLKIRAGYGEVGNQAIPNYGSLALINLAQNQNPEIGTFARPSTAANPNLKWETTKEVNFGVDYGFLNDKITGSIELYSKTTEDLLLDFEIPEPSPVRTRLENIGEVKNEGFEFNTNIKVVSNENFNFDIYGNFSKNKNEIISLSEGNNITSAFGITSFTAPSPQQSTPVYVSRVGEPINSLLGLEFIGFDKNGEEQFRDLNNDGIIDEDNDRKIIGTTQPDFTYGFGFNAGYKRFNLRTFFRGVQGVDVLNSLRNDLENQTVLPVYNALNTVLTNGATTAPSSIVNSRFVEDGSYLRWENITLSYDVDVEKIPFLNGLNIYATGQNLAVFTEYSGYDPEVSGVNYTNYPRARTIIFGINANF